VSVSLSRDAEGSIETVTPEGQATWTITRNVDGSIAGLSNGSTDVSVDRDASGSVSGVVVEEV